MNQQRLINPKLVLFVAIAIIPLSGVGTDLYAPSMPAIAQALHAPASLVKLTMSIYLLGFSLGQIPFGTFADVFGRKYVVFTAIVIFMLASLVAPLTNSIELLLAVRFIQGLAAAGPSTIGKSLCSDTFSGAALRRAVTYFVTSWGLGPVIAPVIGGYLQHYFGWQANFYFFAAFSGVLALIVLLFLQETLACPISLRIGNIAKNYATVLSHPMFIASVICMGMGYALIVSFSVIGSFLVQKDLGYNAITFGHMAFIVAGAYFIGGVCNRVLIVKLHHSHIISAGTVIALLAATAMLVIAFNTPMSLHTIVIPTAIIVFSVGLTNTNLLSETLSLFPNMAGIASSAVGCGFILITSLCTTIASYAKSQTQLPMAWYYLALAALYFVVYVFYLRKQIRT